MKKILLIYILSLASTYVEAQSYKDNFDKYWWYRYKLVNDFMKIGDQCGESVPARMRSFWRGEIPENVTNAKWADATIDLGQYMSVLATEYQLLRQNGLNTDRTLYEMYYAIKAFNRLDLTAEARSRNFEATALCNNINPQTGSGQPYTDDFNGFFIRDDVPYNFVQNNLTHFNRPKVSFPICGTSSAVAGRMNGRVHDYDNVNNTDIYLDWTVKYPGTPNPPPPPQYPDEMSQDQVIEIYTGLSLICHFLGGSETQNGENLKNLAKEALLRLSIYCSLPSGQFLIRNPLTQRCVYGIHPETYENCFDGGGMIFPSAPALTKGLFHVNAGWNGIQFAQVNGLQMQSVIHNPLYQLLKYNLSCSQELIFPTTLTAIGKSWTFILPFINVSRQFLIGQSAICQFRWPHLPLIYRVFHGGGLFHPENFPFQQRSYAGILDLAPRCSFYRYYADRINFEWSSHNRLHEPEQRQYNHDNDLMYFDESNGLDYMMLFNLYCLNDNSYPSFYYNPYYAKNFNTNFPTPFGIGSVSDPREFQFLEFLSSASQIYSNAHVTYRGAKQIVLLPGFRALPGAKFRAYVEDFGGECVRSYILCNKDSTASKPAESGDFFNSNAGATDGTFTGYEPPTDTIPDYEATPEEIAADSAAWYDSLMASDNTLAIEYYQNLVNQENNIPINTKTGINLDKGSGIRLYPNPTDKVIIIELSGPDEIINIKVYDALGKLILDKSYPESTKTTDLNMQSMPQGTYLFKIRTKLTFYTKKVIVL